MAALPISANHRTWLSTIDTALDAAFGDGVDDASAGPHPLLAPMQYYKDRLTTAQKTAVKDVFKTVLAALLVVTGDGTSPYRKVAASGPIVPMDVCVYVEGNGSAVTLTLPAANTVAAGHRFEFKDLSGTATAKNITIARVGGDTMDGASSVVIAVNWGMVTLRCDGVSKYSIV